MCEVIAPDDTLISQEINKLIEDGDWETLSERFETTHLWCITSVKYLFKVIMYYTKYIHAFSIYIEIHTNNAIDYLYELLNV